MLLNNYHLNHLLHEYETHVNYFYNYQLNQFLFLNLDYLAQFFEQRRADVLQRKGIDIALVERLIAERARARQQKDWATGDRITGELSAMDILIEDRADGTTWKVK